MAGGRPRAAAAGGSGGWPWRAASGGGGREFFLGSKVFPVLLSSQYARKSACPKTIIARFILLLTTPPDKLLELWHIIN